VKRELALPIQRFNDSTIQQFNDSTIQRSLLSSLRRLIQGKKKITGRVLDASQHVCPKKRNSGRVLPKQKHFRHNFSAARTSGIPAASRLGDTEKSRRCTRRSNFFRNNGEWL